MVAGERELWTPVSGLRGYLWRSKRPVAALLLQHGFAEYAERYVRQYGGLIPKLQAIGFDVYALDLAGHGDSAGRRGMVDVRQAVAQHTAARRAIGSDQPLYLLGHSLGGLITAASVVSSPSMVAGVVLTSPALLFKTSASSRLTARILCRLTPGLPLVPAQPPDGLSAVADQISALADDERMYHGRVPALTAWSAVEVSETGWGRYRSWTTPTLIMHGDADTYADPKGSALFHGLISSSDKQWIDVPEGRHELLNDVGGDRDIRIILKWLSGRLGPQAYPYDPKVPASE